VPLIQHVWPWYSQPQEVTKPADWAVDGGICWLWSVAQSSNSHLRNLANRSAPIAVSQDTNNELVITPAKDGLTAYNSVGSNASALSYLASTDALSGLTELSLFVWFRFVANATSGQWMNFRTDNQHTLDIFSQTSSSVTWGADWAGAWNGTSKQTLSGLTDGELVCVGASINQSGARLFHQGRLSGTKTGGAFTTSSSSVRVLQSLTQNSQIYGASAYRRALSDLEMMAVTRRPWAQFDPLRIWVPVSAGGAPTTISAGIGAATASGAPASIALTTTVSAGVGAASAQGAAASIGLATVVAAGVGAASAQGSTASVSFPTIVSTSVGTASAQGHASAIVPTTSVAAAVATATAAGLPATIPSGLLISAGVGAAAADGAVASVGETARVAAGVGAATAVAQAATISPFIVVAAAAGAATAEGLSAQLRVGTAVQAGEGAAVAAGHSASVAAALRILAGVGVADASGASPAVKTGPTIVCGAGAATASGAPASVLAATASATAAEIWGYVLSNGLTAEQTTVQTHAMLTTLTSLLSTCPANLALVLKLLRNKQITDPATGLMTVYDDDGTTVLLQGNIYEDAAGITAYRGQGAERRERLT
jgi:hypothetical protein